MTMTGTDTGTARETATTAADEAKRVGHVGAEEVQNVAAEAKNQVRTLVDETRTELNDQSTQQRDRLVATLQTLSLDLEDMASSSQSSGLATELARQAAQRARDLSQQAGRSRAERAPRRGAQLRAPSPGLFLFGAVVAGVVAGRVARGAKASTGTTGSGEYPAPSRVRRPGNRMGCEGGHHRAEPRKPRCPGCAGVLRPLRRRQRRAVTLADEGSRIGGVAWRGDAYGGTP